MNLSGYKDQVRYNEASQTLTFDAPQGRPSADGTVTLYDPRYARDNTAKNPIVTGTATRKAVDTTVTGASGPAQADPRRVVCTPPAALAIGDRVWLTVNATGEMEQVEVKGKASGYFETVHPLRLTYTTGDLVKSAVMTSPAVPTAWVQDQTNLGEDFEAVWTYTVAGTAYVVTTRWDLVREAIDWAPSEADFLDAYPGAQRWSGLKGDPGLLRRTARRATRDVEQLLIRAKLDPDKVRANEIFRDLVVDRVAWRLAHMSGAHPPGDTVEGFKATTDRDWSEATTALLSGQLKIPYDHDEDAVLEPDDYEANALELIR